jgi:protein-tyrosine phosphatase
MIKILFVCHGNICRSPMAEFVMKDLVKKAGREKEFLIESAATSTEEIGNPVHRGTKQKLAQFNISVAGKTARQMTKKDYEEFDYIIAMDSFNTRNIARIVDDKEGKVSKLLNYAGESGDIADPWYTGNFDETYEDVLRGCKGLLKYLDK